MLIALAVGAMTAGLLTQAARVPGAWLIGPMLVGLAAGVSGLAVPRLPRPFLVASQGVVGTLMAGAFDPASVPMIVANWLAVTVTVAGTMLASVAVGIGLTRATPLHRATATLGTLPGGAQGMVAMSVELGADTRAVALMQYARVVLAVLSASLVGRVAIALGATPRSAAGDAFGGVAAATDIRTYLLTATIAALGVWLAPRLRVPAGLFIGPLVLGIVAAEVGVVRTAWPIGFAQAAYVVLGLYVGLMFDRTAVRRVSRQLPAIVASIVALIGLCGLLGLVLVRLTGTDYLTAFLATTPGGLDSLPAIGLSAGADVSLMLAVQMARLFAVVLVGPPLARWLLGRGAAPAVRIPDRA